MTHRIGLIGFGTIATDVINSLRLQLDVQLAALCRRPESCTDTNVQVFTQFDEFIAWAPELVVEVASQNAVQDYAMQSLRHGIPFLVTSVGALADPAFLQQLTEAARAQQTSVLIPSGAVASLDYLQAVRYTQQVEVLYESRKPLAAWKTELQELGYNPKTMTDEVELYSGDAQTAAQRYPKNLNVAATLAVAGVGMASTQVRVVADPTIQHNQHTIRVTSPFGTLQTHLVNQPSPSNPKTSWIVAQSVVATITRHFNPIKIG